MRHVQRGFSLFLAVLMVLSTVFVVSTAAPSTLSGNAVNIAPSPLTFPVSGEVADPDTSGDMGFSNTPRFHDGRIWTDKSVRTGAEEDAFEVTLSALAQYFPVTSGFAIPADTVFVIDVSGSMTNDDTGGQRRINVLIEALNEAIGILMDANPQNRIAVVAYGGRLGGYARVQNVLALGRYTAPGNAFFSVNSAGTEVSVAATAAPGNGSVYNPSVLVQGSTPTQWGIHAGAQVLLNRTDFTAEVPSMDSTGAPDGTVTVTRRPNIILMTDGEPTMGWADWAFTEATNLPAPSPSGVATGADGAPRYGDGSYGEMGLAILTVLTAAHRKQLVFEHVFHYWNGNNPPDGQADDQPAPSVGFYTIGLIGDRHSAYARRLIQATMNPEGNAANVDSDINNDIRNLDEVPASYPIDIAPVNPAITMRTLLDRIATDGTGSNSEAIDFRAQRRGAYHGDYIEWETLRIPEQTTTTNLSATDLNFVSRLPDNNVGFMQAGDLTTLRAAFKSITGSIQQTSNTPVTNVPGVARADFDGWLVFSDVLGEYMQLRPDAGISLEFDSESFSRTGFDLNDPIVLEQYRSILFAHLNYGSPTGMYDVPMRVVDELIKANLDAEITDRVVYYVDRNRNFVGHEDSVNAAARVSVFPMYGTITDPATPPPGGQRNLMYTAFHWVEVLRGGTFNEIFTATAQTPTRRTLAAGDQLIRWYIPASLIPMRTVEFGPNDLIGVPTGNTHPIRVRYTVGLDQARMLTGGAQFQAYAEANRNPVDRSIWFYSNRWRDNENVTLAFYQPHPKNPWFLGRPAVDADRGMPKSANPTVTAPHVTLARNFMLDGDRVELHWLGNNGRLAVAKPPGLLITKAFTFGTGTHAQSRPDDPVPNFTFTITNVAPTPHFSQTVNFPGDFTWQGAPLHRYVLTSTIELAPGTYTVTKQPEDVPIGGFIHLPQPQIGVVTVPSGGTGVANFNNIYVTPRPPGQLPALHVRKEVDPPEVNPPGFEILIEGPVGVRPVDLVESRWVRNTTTNRYEMRLNRAQAIAGADFLNIAPGEYRISEINYRDVPDFIFDGRSWMTRNAAPPDRPIFGSTWPITVTIGSGDDWYVRILNSYMLYPGPGPGPGPGNGGGNGRNGRNGDNDYNDDNGDNGDNDGLEPPPVYPGPPSPPTGDERQIALFVVLLLTGISIIGGTALYYNRKKLFYKDKGL